MPITRPLDFRRQAGAANLLQREFEVRHLASEVASDAIAR